MWYMCKWSGKRTRWTAMLSTAAAHLPIELIWLRLCRCGRCQNVDYSMSHVGLSQVNWVRLFELDALHPDRRSFIYAFEWTFWHKFWSLSFTPRTCVIMQITCSDISYRKRNHNCIPVLEIFQPERRSHPFSVRKCACYRCLNWLS